MSPIDHVRYWLSEKLFYASLIVLPGTRYKLELLCCMYWLKSKVVAEVERDRDARR